MGANPTATQCFWLAADGYLDGPGATGGAWEPDALIRTDGSRTQFLENLARIARGEDPAMRPYGS